jgi:2-desacetyl-2-hydroxyethyl bacteriochlorophyllide A dehydrogenase
MGDSVMKALVYVAPEHMEMQDLEVPQVGPDDILIRVAYSGICGSELSGYLGKNSLRKPPLVFGHELSGHVAAAGPGVGAWRELAVGSPVTVNPLLACGRCEFCVAGRQQLCGSRLLLGASLPGCNAEYVSVPASSVLALPGEMDLRRAAMAEPAACAAHAVELGGARPGTSALVVGAGPIGLFILQILGLYGVTQRYVSERNADRLTMATAMGCIAVPAGDPQATAAVREATGGRGVDMAFDAVGSAETRQTCVAVAVAGGQIITVGLHTDVTELPLNTLIRSELSIRGVFAYSVSSFRAALGWLAERRIGLQDGVVVAPLTDGPVWYQRLIDGDAAAKVLLSPGSAGPQGTGVPRLEATVGGNS